MILYLLGEDLPWWHDLTALAEGPLTGADAVRGGVHEAEEPADARVPGSARARLLRALVERRLEDPWTAAADALLFGASGAWGAADDAPGVSRVLVRDVAVIQSVTARALDQDARRAEAPLAAQGSEPDLVQLGPAAEPSVADLAERLRAHEDPMELVADVLRFRRTRGGGALGRYRAFRWDGRALRGVAEPTTADSARLAELDRVLSLLEANTIAFLRGRPAMHVLLYGPRGSGKSTAVRGLLRRHAPRGLRLVELPPGALTDLPEVLARLAERPERFLLFVDDLSFETGDDRYHPLKTLLEGSVARRPENVRLYATSNRRHLVQERLRDRPDPLDDDVHAWDTQHERLALADRFGLLLTFPSADRRRYLEIVRHLAAREDVNEPDLEERAERFARHGNGYSGRTAQQFVDAVRSGLA